MSLLDDLKSFIMQKSCNHKISAMLHLFAIFYDTIR